MIPDDNSCRPTAALRAALLAIILASGLLLAPVVTAQPASRPHRSLDAACVLDDTSGAITEVLLHYDPACIRELAPTYNDLFRALGPLVRVQVLCPNQNAVANFFMHWGAKAAGDGRPLQVISVNRPISVWARDRRIARADLRNGRPARTFVPADVADYDDDKRNDLALPRMLARRGILPGVLGGDIHIEGGNVVANNRHVFVGINVMDDNQDKVPQRARLVQRLERVFGRSVVLVRDEHDTVPWCHVDMYLTPLDDRTILLADPSAAELALMKAGEMDVCDIDDLPLVNPDYPLTYGDESLDAVARQLEALGYTVHRLPAVLDPYEDWVITYNNVLLERRQGRRIVYLPTYAISTLDNAAAKIYQSLGCEVHRIDVTGVYKCGGAVRCLVNVTARQPNEVRLVKPGPRHQSPRARVRHSPTSRPSPSLH